MPHTSRWARRASFVALLGGLCLAGSASAYQSLPTDARINEYGSGMPGVDWNTPPAGVDYDAVGAPVEAHDGEMHVGGTIPTLNYHTPSDPTTNVNFNFVPDLDFSLEAAYLNTSATYTGSGNYWTLETTFGATDDGDWDLILTDPGDSDAEVLRANLVAGTFNGSPVEALTATSTIDITAIDKNQIVTAFAFFEIDPTSPYASLLTDTEYLGFNISQALNWEIGDADGEYDFNDIANEILSSGTLISFTAEANGALYGISSSKFTPAPEPGTGLLLGLGLLLLGLRRH